MTTHIINTMICLGFTLKNIEENYLSFSKRYKNGFTFIKVNTEEDILMTCLSFNFNTDFMKSKSVIFSQSSIDFSLKLIEILKFISYHLNVNTLQYEI